MDELSAIAHVIHLSVAPVFLLSGIGAMATKHLRMGAKRVHGSGRRLTRVAVMGAAVAQGFSPSTVPGVSGVSFGQAQRYKDTSGKEMCSIVHVLPDPPVFPRGTTAVSYGVHLQPRAVKQASAQVVVPAGQELRRQPCSAFTPIERGFSQTLLGSTLSRVDGKPLVPGKYTLRVTADGRSAEFTFEIGR